MFGHIQFRVSISANSGEQVVVTLTARELAPNAKIIAAVREGENQHLLQQSGADTTVALRADDAETISRTLLLAQRGVWCVRVHEVRASRDALRVLDRLTEEEQ